jgi:hypothetical protein
MNDRPAYIDLEQLLALSLSMLEKAVAQSWDELCVLEARRRELLEPFLLTPVAPDCAAAVAAGIKTIIAIDRDIMTLSELKKFDLAQTLQTLDQGKKAVKAYTS